MNEYPEHSKLREIRRKSQAIGDFLVWLQSGEAGPNGEKIQLAYYPIIKEKKDRRGEYIKLSDEEQYESSTLESLTYQIEDLLAAFFGIDRDKLEDEKIAMLEALRKNVMENMLVIGDASKKVDEKRK